MASFRQVDDRHVAAVATLMEWSPSMDLIALATIQGEVFVHRLTWQKVWTLASPGGKESDTCITTLAWRPDGKVLAVAYNNGHVILCDVEKGNIVHSFERESIVTSLAWVPKSDISQTVTPSIAFYEDLSTTFLPKPPSLSKTFGSAKTVEENADNVKKLKDQSVLNLLVIGTSTGQLVLYCFGVFQAGEVILTTEAITSTNPLKIITVSISNNLSLLKVLGEIKTEENTYNYVLMSFSIPLLKEKHQEMQTISQKYAEVTYLMSYLTTTIKAISEAWEDILLEIDSKLMNYAETKFKTKSGTVSDDFLELLMFGTPSEELEQFLLKELTEKGLKKLGHSIELSYSNIQKLVLKHLQNVTQALFYHLSDLKGMALWEERFAEVALERQPVLNAVTATASFMLKATEIQQVIDTSMKNFKAFFRWLYAIILRLSDEPIPPEITKVTQQDLNFVAEFLKENFATEWNQEKKSTFSLERVGQYLKPETLTFAPNTENDNPWLKFLSNHPEIQETGLIYQHCPEKSLIMQHNELEMAIKQAFKGPSTVLSNSLHKTDEVLLLSAPTSTSLTLKSSSFCGSKTEYFSFALALENTPCRNLFIIRQHIVNTSDYQVIKAYFGRFKIGTESESLVEEKKHFVIDFQFYNEDTLTVLVLEDNDGSEENKAVPILIQFPLKGLWSSPLNKAKKVFEYFPCNIADSLSEVDVGSYVEKMNSRRLENVRALSLAVSGSRKVACLLFASRRRVRLFEMDVEDDEDDTEDIDPDDSLACREDNDIAKHPITTGEEGKENSF